MNVITKNRLYLTLSPARYLKFIQNSSNRDSIFRVKFIPPKLGSNNGFGKVSIELKYDTKKPAAKA